VNRGRGAVRRVAICLAVLAGWLTVAVALVPAAVADESVDLVAGTFEMKASHGYTLGVTAGPDPFHPGKGRVTIALRRGGSSAEYSAPANLTPTSIDADLGSLGRISVNFVPSGVAARHSVCGKPRTFESGAYEGEIAFHGEGGYADAAATKVDGLVGPWTNFFCIGSGPAETSGPGIFGARLRVRTPGQGNGFFLQVDKNHRGARVPFYVVTGDQRGAISAVRTVEGMAAPGAFTFDSRLQTASLALPAPFSGRAEFNRDAARSGQWSGSLSIDFPGLADMPLTGPSTRAELVHREVFP